MLRWPDLALTLLLLLAPLDLGAENLLAGSPSPYLRHHADDPIPWRPWNDDALEQARSEEKLILLSIGYDACHWCGVMARETFSHPEVIRLLSQSYVPILVDREERPDIDAYFLNVAEAMTGRSGWPQNLILTPDRLPLFAGNFMPPLARHGEPGFADVLKDLARVWQEERSRLLDRQGMVRQQLELLSQETLGVARDSAEGAVDPRPEAVRRVMASLDTEFGGLREEPRFPHATVWSLLLREGARMDRPEWIDAAIHALDHLAMGGMRDLLGGGFHRYCADRACSKPHFEMMLSDQALLARVYLEAWRLRGETRHALVARGILDHLLTRFRLPDGALADALAADSPEGEGAYYLWTRRQVKQALPAKLAKGLRPHLEVGETPGVLRLKGDPLPWEKALKTHAEALEQLARVREKRPPPRRDDKAVTSWNALAAGTLALGGRLLDEPRYLEVAREILLALSDAFETTGVLPHTRLHGVVGGGRFLDDDAFTLQGLLDLYESDPQPEVLERAARLADAMVARFPRTGEGLFPLTLPGEEKGVPPQAVVLDRHGWSSGNAAAWTALARLNLWREDPALTALLDQGLGPLGRALAGRGQHGADLLRLWDYRPERALEVVVVGPWGDQGTQALLRTAQRHLGEGAVLGWVDPARPFDPKRWPVLAHRPMLDGKPTAYVCQGGLCARPVTDGESMLAEWRRLRAPGT